MDLRHLLVVSPADSFLQVRGPLPSCPTRTPGSSFGFSTLRDRCGTCSACRRSGPRKQPAPPPPTTQGPQPPLRGYLQQVTRQRKTPALDPTFEQHTVTLGRVPLASLPGNISCSPRSHSESGPRPAFPPPQPAAAPPSAKGGAPCTLRRQGDRPQYHTHSVYPAESHQ